MRAMLLQVPQILLLLFILKNQQFKFLTEGFCQIFVKF
jgi:hypothetical protein